MGDTSDEREDTEMDWEIQSKRNKKRNRKSRESAWSDGSSSMSLNEQERERIHKIIGIEKPIHKKTRTDNIAKSSHTKTTETKPTTKNSTNYSRPGPSSTAQKNENNQAIEKQINTKKINYSQTMQSILYKKYKHIFYITTKEDISRIKFADKWSAYYPTSKDVIIKTKQGFVLKSDNEKATLKTTLKELQTKKYITKFEEGIPAPLPTAKTFQPSFSAIISKVEIDINEVNISEHLTANNINHRFCKRIVSRARDKPTMMIRIITGCSTSFQKLLHEGIFYKNQHYPAYPSNPPSPIPVPCSKCSSFTHTTEQCTTNVKCLKCQGSHPTIKCTSPLPVTCAACGSHEHVPWSIQCPKRPKKPIEGIPNTKIKCINKKTDELDNKITRNSRIHTPITPHDYIINKYLSKINKPKYTDRQELIKTLRNRFIEQFNIETSVHFTGNRIYILMFDLTDRDSESPTQPTEGVQVQNVLY